MDGGHSGGTVRSRSSQSPSPSHSASASASSSVHHKRKFQPTAAGAAPFSLSDTGALTSNDDRDSISAREEEEDDTEDEEDDDEEDEDEEEEDNDSMRLFTAARLDPHGNVVGGMNSRNSAKPPKPDGLQMKVDSASVGGASESGGKEERGMAGLSAQQNAGSAGLIPGIVVKDDTVKGIFTENIQTSGAYSAREEGLKREEMISATSNDKTYVHWTSDMDWTLSDILLKEHGKGCKTPNGWKTTAFTTTIKVMAETYNMTFTKEQIKARLKTWNKYYKEVTAMLEINGFRWDWKKNMIRVDDEEVWDNYVKIHPTVKHYRDMVIINWSNLDILCDHDRDTRSFVATTNEALNDFDVESIAEESQTAAESLVGGSSRQRKWKRSPADRITDAINRMTATMEQTATAIRNATSKPIVLYNDQIHEALVRLDDLEETELLKAMDLLGDNRDKFERFMSLPDRLRTPWLRLQFYGD